MEKADRFIVPGTVVAAMLAMFFVTNAWIKRPVDTLHWRVTMGPLNITMLRHPYGLRFTPRNSLSGHAIKTLIPLAHDCPPPHRECIDVTITDRSLTYIHRTTAYRLPDGSYRIADKGGYAFPRSDDYVIFVEMQPKGGDYEAKRIPEVGALHLGVCRPRGCRGRTTLRGLEVVRAQNVGGLTVVLGTPTRALDSGGPAQVGLVFLRGGRTALDVVPPSDDGDGGGDAIAISMDTYHFVRLHVDPARSARGVIAYTGTFSAASIYRVWAPIPAYPRPTAQASQGPQANFVVDVNPAPTPTPAIQ